MHFYFTCIIDDYFHCFHGCESYLPRPRPKVPPRLCTRVLGRPWNPSAQKPAAQNGVLLGLCGPCLHPVPGAARPLRHPYQHPTLRPRPQARRGNDIRQEHSIVVSAGAMMDVVILAGLIRTPWGDRRCLHRKTRNGSVSCKNALGQICVMLDKSFPYRKDYPLCGK